MTIDEVEIKVKQIIDIQNDPERAHSKEDELYEEVLESIQKTAHTDTSNCAACLARIALYTKQLTFSRWCS